VARKLLNKVKYLFLCFLIPAVLAGCPSSYYSQLTVKEVIDGDTVILSNGRHLRLIGIDTPEIREKTPEGFVYSPQPFSLIAKKMLERLVLEKEIIIEQDKTRQDQYNRQLGYLFFTQDNEKVFVNRELVRQGLAVVSVYPPNVKYVSELIQAQSRARQEHIRLWEKERILTPGLTAEHIGQIRVVRGRVVSAYNFGRRIYLNLGPDYKTDCKLVIFKDAWKYFQEQSIDPQEYYLNKTVETAGKIRDYNGPQIIVSHPLQINIIDTGLNEQIAR
jgi:micrococcal nuclease